MALIDDLKKLTAGLPAELSEKNGQFSFEMLIAERKAFLSKKKLTYQARFSLDEANKKLNFTEMLKESGFGLSSGGGFDSEMSPGFGFKTETYNTLSGARKGTIKEQSDLFGKKYDYQFDFEKIRKQFEEKAAAAGYQFEYSVF